MERINELQNITQQIRSVNGLINLFKDSVDNDTRISTLLSYRDNIDLIIIKLKDLEKIFEQDSAFLIENEDYEETNINISIVFSLVKILKIALYSNKYDAIDFEDLYNYLNTISKIMEKIIVHAKNLRCESAENIKPIWE